MLFPTFFSGSRKKSRWETAVKNIVHQLVNRLGCLKSFLPCGERCFRQPENLYKTHLPPVQCST